jgi:hypothetical protein
LREEVLNDKGWDIVRIWSTDWFENPTLQTDRLVEKLELLRRKPAVDQAHYAIATETVQSAEQTPELELPVVDPSVEPTVLEEASPGPSAEPLPEDEGTLTEAECFEALRRLRDQVIAVEMADWEPQRSLLRETMIETFVRQRFTDPAEWFDKVPGYLRQGTNPVEKGRYLERVCDTVGRLTDGTAIERRTTSPSPDHQSRVPDPEQDATIPDADDKRSPGLNGNEYAPTNFPLLGIRPDPSRFYDREYEPVL